MLIERMSRSRKIDLEQIRASLDKMCPKCGATITPDLVKRVDFEWIECPKCGEKFQPGAKERESIFSRAMAGNG
jgi:ribosomal protein L37AE/L43A